jgi:hypothetical protein
MVQLQMREKLLSFCKVKHENKRPTSQAKPAAWGDGHPMRWRSAKCEMAFGRAKMERAIRGLVLLYDNDPYCCALPDAALSSYRFVPEYWLKGRTRASDRLRTDFRNRMRCAVSVRIVLRSVSGGQWSR